MTVAVVDAIREVTDAVEKIKNDAPQNFPLAASVGDAVRQGDIYLQKIEDLTEPPTFFKRLQNPSFPYQLAPGNTKGSRHCVEESAGLEIYIPESAEFFNEATGEMDFEANRVFQQRTSTYITNKLGMQPEDIWRNDAARAAHNELLSALTFAGPILKVANTATVSHPEHGNWILPAGTYRCVFQRTVSSENRIRRVMD